MLQNINSSEYNLLFLSDLGCPFVMMCAPSENYFGLDTATAVATSTNPLSVSTPADSMDPTIFTSMTSPSALGGFSTWLDSSRPTTIDTKVLNSTAVVDAVGGISPYMQSSSALFPFNPTVPPPVPADEVVCQSMILRQIEFYFSEDNLARDTFLRRQMDDDGWVPLAVIAKFNRVASLSSDIDKIMTVIFICCIELLSC